MSNDLDWILTAKLLVLHNDARDETLLFRLDGTVPLQSCLLSWSEEHNEQGHHKLLFNGEYIETEDFYGVMGIIDEVMEEPIQEIFGLQLRQCIIEESFFA